MKTVQAIFRAIRALLAYCHDADGIESYRTVTADACASAQRMKGISDSYKALLLASPGR
jgi:hypothetical protein